jgi:flagellar biosynthesis/type III secretory pathway protein FliH
MYTESMKIKKITKKIEQYAAESYSLGYFNATAEVYTEAYDEGYDDGLAKEQSRIQSVLDMHIQWALESGKGSEVIMLNKIKEVIVPIVIKEDVEDGF